MSNGREYTAELKEEAVKLFKERGETISKVAKDLGISSNVLGKWIKKYNEKKSVANAFPGRGNVAPYDKERFDLKKELARVTRERDILKKALGSQKE
ncbi:MULTISPECIES: transposase [unclassified Wolbachia]|uniref:transposase n=2 Tax=unclassified Wolbachia TaxID=2640676 RepID=UPI0022328B6E|nr:transposase [Wolbachia endosymbiont (group A) of Apoderus coryli]